MALAVTSEAWRAADLFWWWCGVTGEWDLGCSPPARAAWSCSVTSMAGGLGWLLVQALGWHGMGATGLVGWIRLISSKREWAVVCLERSRLMERGLTARSSSTGKFMWEILPGFVLGWVRSR